MTNYTYSKEEVQSRLESLPCRSSIAFGLSCCERMFANYIAFKSEAKWGDDQPLRKALDELWRHVEGQMIDELTVRQLLSNCEVVAPDSDDFSSLLTGPAQEACFSICCVLDYVLKGNPERIAQASSFAVDTLDLYVSALLDGFDRTPKAIFNGEERNEQIRLHPLMQRELARQDADLKLLATNPDLRALKAQWRAPGKSNIDL
jgi:uncharacterized protein YjaG (DUF416 family)